MLQLIRSGAGLFAWLAAMSLAAIALALAAGSGAEAAEDVVGSWDWSGLELRRQLGDLMVRFEAVVRVGFERQPAAMLAILGAAAIPLVSAMVAVSRLLRRSVAGAGRGVDSVRTGPAALSSAAGAAWIELESPRGSRLTIGELTQIGRSDDCDVALGDASVDPTHALIRRTPECEFIIIDVSATGGAGLAINGRRLRQGRLRDGDRIEIGAARVVFRQPVGAGAMTVAG